MHCAVRALTLFLRPSRMRGKMDRRIDRSSSGSKDLWKNFSWYIDYILHCRVCVPKDTVFEFTMMTTTMTITTTTTIHYRYSYQNIDRSRYASFGTLLFILLIHITSRTHEISNAKANRATLTSRKRVTITTWLRIVFIVVPVGSPSRFSIIFIVMVSLKRLTTII